MRRALVVGAGVAGLTCAHLLAEHGWNVHVWDLGVNRTPPLVLNDGTVWLLRDLWRGGDELVEGAVRLRVRTVQWGRGPETTVRQPGVVVDGGLLRQRLLGRLVEAHPDRVCLFEVPAAGLTERLAEVRPAVRVFDASGRRAHAATVLGKARRRILGRRCILTAPVTLAEHCASEACWMETVSDGWVFLAPIEAGRAVLQAMVPHSPGDPEDTLRRLHAETRLISRRVDELAGWVSVFAAAPQCSDPLLGHRWIAIGDAAIALDPVSGDGTGHGLRGAILATSVIEAIASGCPDRSYLDHYHTRLVEAFQVHLQRCLAHYSTAFSSPAWLEECTTTARALQAMSSSGPPPQFRYALHGLHLMPLRSARVRTL